MDLILQQNDDKLNMLKIFKAKRKFCVNPIYPVQQTSGIRCRKPEFLCVCWRFSGNPYFC
jgi:hypothetical protein